MYDNMKIMKSENKEHIVEKKKFEVIKKEFEYKIVTLEKKTEDTIKNLGIESKRLDYEKFKRIERNKNILQIVKKEHENRAKKQAKKELINKK
jgi:hypothetical protein